MINKLIIHNFRCYINTTIHFNGTSIVVGKNNAGKSTMIEALKIISSVTRKYKTARFVFAPEWVGKDTYGISPNVENMNISDRGIFNMYGNPPAIIEAEFSNGTSIQAFVGEGLEIFATIYDSDGCQITNSKQAKNVEIPLIEVLPQISPVLDNEKIINKKTVDGNRSTRLASRNFRNQLYYYEEAFPTFKNLVESTWESLCVNPIESYYEGDGRMLQLFVRVNNFEAEIGWMGHGLQMWIQTMWFISQCQNNAIVVLDEPDVYMHADLQRRLIRLITPMFPQLIIATHSLEIIEEVPAECLIPINSKKTNIKPIGNEASLQFIAETLGTSFNIDLARFFISNQLLVWEGDDTSRKILSAFQSVIHPNELHPLINLPKVYIKGWDNWDKIKTVADIFTHSQLNMKLYCVLNPNQQSENEIEQRKQNAKKNKIGIHIWEKREIENYAINYNVIFRYLLQKKEDSSISEILIQNKINEIIDKLQNDIATSNNNTKQCDNPLHIISGRKFFKLLSSWTLEEFGITINARKIIPYFHVSEVPIEIKKVINEIMKS